MKSVRIYAIMRSDIGNNVAVREIVVITDRIYGVLYKGWHKY